MDDWVEKVLVENEREATVTMECEVVSGRVPESAVPDSEPTVIEGVREPTTADQVEILSYNEETET